MQRLTLKRIESNSRVTLGFIYFDNFIYHTLELPWKNNKLFISCIPDGVYRCAIRQSPKNGEVYELQGVSGRTYIQIHTANIASDLSGCIAIGCRFGTQLGQLAVLSSKRANNKFKEALNYEPFELEIVTC